MILLVNGLEIKLSALLQGKTKQNTYVQPNKKVTFSIKDSIIPILISSFFEIHFKIKTSDNIFRRFDLAEIIFKFEKNE